MIYVECLYEYYKYENGIVNNDANQNKRKNERVAKDIEIISHKKYFDQLEFPESENKLQTDKFSKN